MTSVAAATPADRVDWKLVVSSGIKLGILTSIGVAAFAFLSRGMSGSAEVIVQSILVLVGGVVFSFAPAMFLTPTEVDTISWTAMIGLLGALTYTVVDVVLFRPIGLYHWTWDQIGGGSGYWYHPVWWMGAAFLAWLGSWVVSNGGGEGRVGAAAVGAVIAGVVVSALLMVTGITPFHSAAVALGFTIGLTALVPISAVMRRG